MTPTERRATGALASIFALRMLGLFLVLPVFALSAGSYAGGGNIVLVGIAMGVYGLTQGVLQLPFGLASDRWGRKRVIVVGLLIFAAGSFLAGSANTIIGLIAGRMLQGAGAVSAAVTAFLADATRDHVRTKAMALVGASIGLTFSLSLVVAPALAALIGLNGLFHLTGVLALLGVGVVIWLAPDEPVVHKDAGRGGLMQVLRMASLARLNAGVFILHAVQLAMWVAIPALLVQAGLPRESHWQVYLPAVLGSFVVMGGLLFPLEKRGYLRAVFLSAIGLIGLAQFGLLLVASGEPTVMALSLWLFVFFCGFNILEASQPSLVSRLAPANSRGAAMGVYNTLQSLGFFVGGFVGGRIVYSGTQKLFLVCAAATFIWLILAWKMKAPARAQAA